MAFSAEQLIDELRVEGVNYRGYGIIPKFVMLDTDLTIEAKGIYAYFCSYAGSGNSAFPGRDKILADLDVSKDTYYKHFRKLTEEGYITVKQVSKGGKGQGFQNNVYTIVSSPDKFVRRKKEQGRGEPLIKAGEIKSFGYGFIPKAVMTDSRLSLKAKALYAYYAAYTGSGESAYPARDVIFYQLGISHNSFNKFNRQLLETGYVEVVQRIVNGSFGVNDYILVDKPEIQEGKQAAVKRTFTQTKISDTLNKDTQSGAKTNFSDTQISDTHFPDAQIQDTNKNSSISNKKDNQQSNNRREGQEDAVFSSEFSLDRFQAAKLVKDTNDFERLSNASNYEHLPNGSFEHAAYLLYIEALTDMLSSPKGCRIQGELISAQEVREHMDRYMKTSPSGKVFLDTIRQVALDSYRAACKSQDIKNHLGYMKSCIWNALKTGDIATEAQILMDM